MRRASAATAASGGAGNAAGLRPRWEAALDPSGSALLGNAIRIGPRGGCLPTGNPTEFEIRDWCIKYLARTLELPDQSIDPDAKFARLGLDSANSVYLIVELEDWLGLEFTPDLVFEHPTISDLARYLAGRVAGENGIG